MRKKGRYIFGGIIIKIFNIHKSAQQNTFHKPKIVKDAKERVERVLLSMRKYEKQKGHKLSNFFLVN